MGGQYQFQNLIDVLLENASKLRQLKELDIKEAFPLIDTLGGADPNYKHSPWDFPMRNNFYTQIPDGLAPYEVITKISAIFNQTMTIIQDLYPTKIKSGQMYVDLETNFDRITKIIEKGLIDLEGISKRISSGVSDHATEVLSLPKLRHLRNKITMMGYEFVKSGFRDIPSDLQGQFINIQNKQYMQHIENQVTPQVSQFAKPKSEDIDYYSGW